MKIKNSKLSISDKLLFLYNVHIRNYLFSEYWLKIVKTIFYKNFKAFAINLYTTLEYWFSS